MKKKTVDNYPLEKEISIKDSRKSSALVFNHEILKDKFPVAITAQQTENNVAHVVRDFAAASESDYEKALEISRERATSADNRSLNANSQILSKLLGKNLPPREMQLITPIILKHLPTFETQTAESFDFINELNDIQLQLPENFFLKSIREETTLLDTVLSESGLKKLMECYAQSIDAYGYAFNTAEEFIANIPNIAIKALQKPAACLVCLDQSKRHTTSFYFKFENDKLKVYLFDTTGLNLPVYPCGERLDDNVVHYVPKLPLVLEALQSNNIAIALMPINLVRSIQKDKSSCTMSNFLFFKSMHAGEYQSLDNIGIMECFGEKPFLPGNSSTHIFAVKVGFYQKFWRFEVSLFTVTSKSLLAGCQDPLAFLFILDSLPNPDHLSIDLVKYQTDWQRKIKNSAGESITRNVFWQSAYVELLKWFNDCYLGNVTAFPDFDGLLSQGAPLRQEYSAFELSLATRPRLAGSNRSDTSTLSNSRVSFLSNSREKNLVPPNELRRSASHNKENVDVLYTQRTSKCDF